MKPPVLAAAILDRVLQIELKVWYDPGSGLAAREWTAINPTLRVTRGQREKGPKTQKAASSGLFVFSGVVPSGPLTGTSESGAAASTEHQCPAVNK